MKIDIVTADWRKFPCSRLMEFLHRSCFNKSHIKSIMHARMRSKWAYVRRYNVINSQLEKIVKDHHSRTLPSLTADDNSPVAVTTVAYE